MSQTMSLTEYQKAVDAWIQSTGKGYFPPLSMLAQLTEELGEVARCVNRTWGAQKSKPGEELNLADEVAGMLFAISCLANVAEIDLTAAVQKHLDKITQRDAKRFVG